LRTSSIDSFERVLPRRRSFELPGGFGLLACSMPLGLIFGRGGPPLSRAISSSAAQSLAH
jgi:hypothetical protein